MLDLATQLDFSFWFVMIVAFSSTWLLVRLGRVSSLSLTIPSFYTTSNIYTLLMSTIRARCLVEAVKRDFLIGANELDKSYRDVNALFAGLCSKLSYSKIKPQLSYFIDRHSSWKHIALSSFPKWFSKELKDLVVLEKTLHKQFKISHNPGDSGNFFAMREQHKALSGQCRCGYVDFVD